MMGDCFPAAQHVCPTGAERNHAFLMIWAAGLLIYFPPGSILIRRGKVAFELIAGTGRKLAFDP